MENTIAMNGGDGPNSYFHNSKYQEDAMDRTKILLIASIQENLDTQKTLKVFTTADIGCSVGPNTFSCVNTIIQAVKFKFQIQFTELISPHEFQVFFSDSFSNDFNALFKALPLDKQYMAAGVPGSFYGRLFPTKSMNFMHSSLALHRMAKVPKEVTEKNSVAWNQGRISYVRSSSEVKKAFTAQFMCDFKAFIDARSEELAPGGLMVILIPSKPHESEPCLIDILDVLGDVFEDMAKQGLVSEENTDSFNLPIYVPTPSEVIKVVSSNEHLNIVKVEETFIPLTLNSAEDIRRCSLHVRAATEGTIREHFGSDLDTNCLFKIYCNKLEEFAPRFKNVGKIKNIFLVVKRVMKGELV